MSARSDTAFTWAHRASQRGMALAYASNIALTAVAWPAVARFYHPWVNYPAAVAMVLVGLWFISQTLRQRFRRADFQIVMATLLVALLAMAVAPTTQPAPAGWSWTQGWAVSTVCGALLLLPRRRAVPAVVAITGLQWWVRIAVVPMGIAFVEAVIPIVGATIVAWAARSATEKFEQVRAALALAARAEEQVADADAQSAAQQWWNRLLHDKVLGALLLASRATSPTLLAQAREVAGDALTTFRQIEGSIGETPASLEEAGSDDHADAAAPRGLKSGLTRLACRHGLTIDLTLRGREGSAPPPITEAMLAAADQALRNVAQHSGQSAVRVRVVQSTTRVRVEIRDHGRGFDIAQLGTRRLGLNTSIPGHLALVDGTAAVTSRPGRGTTVALEWAAEHGAERGAPITATQLRSWWWIAALFAGLHVVGGVLQGQPFVFGIPGWVGLVLILLAYVLMHTVGDGPSLNFGIALVLLGCALMIWKTPLSVAHGWNLWFMGACHAALVVPALRGRPLLSMVGGLGVFTIIVGAFALRSPHPLDAGQLAIPFLVIPTVAALYAVMLGRADGRLRKAQEAEATARMGLRAAEARQQLVRSQLTMLAPGTIDLLEKLVSGQLITAADRSAARLMEAANRDQLVAPEVLNEEMLEVLSATRARGVVVHLTSLAVSVANVPVQVGGPGSAHQQRLTDFRSVLARLAASSVRGDEITARWQPSNSFASGTITVMSDREDAEAFETIPPLGVVTVPRSSPSSRTPGTAEGSVDT